MRHFETGATRDSADGKIDYDGFLSPLTLAAFGEYMNDNRIQADGKLRDSDNWQKGIPMEQYAKSEWRHHVEFWAIRRGYHVYHEKRYVDGKKIEKTHILPKKLEKLPEGWEAVSILQAACGLMFNINGFVHEYQKEQLNDSGLQ